MASFGASLGRRLVDLLEAQRSPASTTDAIMQQAGEHGGRVCLIGPTGEVDQLLRIGLVVVELRAVAAVRTPFGIAEAFCPQAVSAVNLRQGRASGSGRWIAEHGNEAGSRKLGWGWQVA
jgi:hypothetical protein